MLNVVKPSTFYISFEGEIPKRFILKESGKTYFERILDGKTPRIKFNIPDIGQYSSPNKFKIEKVVDIETPKLDFTLPPYERNRLRDFVIVDNPKLNNTPARIFTFDGIVEKGKDFYKFPRPMRIFFLLHEVGHFYYQKEEYCDLFALINFLQMGYNMSTAMYCLTNVLRRTPENKKRILFIFNQMFKNK